MRSPLNDLHEDLPNIYSDANATGTHERHSVDFVVSVLEAYRDQPKDRHSEYARTWQDIYMYSYTRADKQRFPLIVTEAKLAEGGKADYVEVELQAQRACEAYLDSTERVVDKIAALTAVGPTFRGWIYTRDKPRWTPAWGSPTEYDPTLYIDAASPYSWFIYNFIKTVVTSCILRNVDLSLCKRDSVSYNFQLLNFACSFSTSFGFDTHLVRSLCRYEKRTAWLQHPET